MHSFGKTICALLILAGLTTPCFSRSANIAVSATILSKSNCKFNTNTANLAFGNVDPLVALDVTRQATLSFVCNGKDNPATYILVDDDGLNENASNGNRMLHDTLAGNYLPYSFSMTPVTKTVPKGEVQTLTVTGILYGSDYRAAYIGDYLDTITITINP